MQPMTLTERCLFIHKILMGCETHEQLYSVLNIIDNSISKTIFPTYKIEMIVEVQATLINEVEKRREKIMSCMSVNKKQ